jgi:LmbE family N-acetylglucosaminyl deacetylase
MYDSDDIDSIATTITTWEIAAQQMPLTDLTEIVTACQSGLAHNLNAFHDLYDGHPDHASAGDLTAALGAIARQAMATAIFTLGINQRARRIARQN